MSEIRDYVETMDLHYLAETDIAELERQEATGEFSPDFLERRARDWNEDIEREANADAKCYAGTHGNEFI